MKRRSKPQLSKPKGCRIHPGPWTFEKTSKGLKRTCGACGESIIEVAQGSFSKTTGPLRAGSESRKSKREYYLQKKQKAAESVQLSEVIE